LLQAFIAGLTGDKSMSEGFTKSQLIAERWGDRVRGFLGWVVAYRKPLLELAAIIVGMWAVSKVAAAITATIGLIRGLIAAYNAMKASALLAGIAGYFALNPLAGVAAAAIAGAIMAKGADLIGNFISPDVGMPEMPSGAGETAGSIIPKVTVPNVGAVTGGAGAPIAKVPQPSAFESGASPADVRRGEEASINNYINISGPIDSESTAQAIVEVLNNSKLRGGYGGQLIL
jgi:hypothetical protein